MGCDGGLWEAPDTCTRRVDPCGHMMIDTGTVFLVQYLKEVIDTG